MLDPSSDPLSHIICENDQNQINDDNFNQCVYKKIGNDLTIEIGSGSFGTVYKAMNELTSEIVAIKEISIDSMDDLKYKQSNKIYFQNDNNYTSLDLIQNEIDTLKMLNDIENDEKNHNIVKFIDSYKSSKLISLVIEYCPGGNLLNYINAVGALNESLAGQIFDQICEAINYCNNEKFIAHRDLKLENILIISIPNIKLADFGMSISTVSKDSTEDENKRNLCTSFVGSIFYSAPEILCKIPYDPILADIWSLGVILYIMVSGTLPWYIDNRNRNQNGLLDSIGFHDTPSLLTSVQTKQVMKQIMAGIYQPLPDEISPECKYLIFSMLQVNPKKRPTIDQILESSWLQKTRNMTLIMPDDSKYKCSLVDSLPKLNNHKSNKKTNHSMSSSLQNIKQNAFQKLNPKGKKRSSTNPQPNLIGLSSKKLPPRINGYINRNVHSNIKSHSNCFNLVNKI